MEISRDVLGALCALGSALTWALIGLFVRALAPHLGSVALNVARCALGSAMLLAWVLATSGPGAIAAIPLRVALILTASVIVSSALGDTLFFESTKGLGLARAMTISTTYPLMSAGLAALFLGEAVATPVLLGSVVTLVGIALIVTARGDVGSSPAHFRLGLAAALLAALSWAGSAIILKGPLEQVDPVVAQVWRLPVVAAALLATPWGWSSVGQLRRHGRPLGGRLLVVGALTVGSSVFFMAGLKYTSVAIATVLSSCAPLFALPLGRVFLGEPVTWRALAGSAITVLGIALLGL